MQIEKLGQKFRYALREFAHSQWMNSVRNKRRYSDRESSYDTGVSVDTSMSLANKTEARGRCEI